MKVYFRDIRDTREEDTVNEVRTYASASPRILLERAGGIKIVLS